MVKKELPFVMGVLGDFSGTNPTERRSTKPLSQTKIISIDRDNFNEVLAPHDSSA